MGMRLVKAETETISKEEALNDLTLASEYIMCAIRALYTGHNDFQEPLGWAMSKLKDATGGSI